MEPVATYRRRIGASLARIWENVLDWEHLPWLHRSSFLGVELLESGSEGWRAWVSLPPAERERRSLVDVRLHRSDLHYWTRTVDGFGTGSGIRTALAPEGDRATEITVEFFVPGVSGDAARAVGEAYTRLYAQLWDEDEAMMIRRQELLDARSRAAVPPQRLELGPVESLRDRLPLNVADDGRAVRLLLVEGEIVAHAGICPHLGGSLDRGDVCGTIVTCPWHGYRFDVRSGRSADGRHLRLAPAPRVVIDDGNVALVWST